MLIVFCEMFRIFTQINLDLNWMTEILYITQYIVFMAKILSKKLLIVMNVCVIIGTIGKVFWMIDDFQRGKTFEGWGEILSVLLMVGVAIYVNVRYFKEKDKE